MFFDLSTMTTLGVFALGVAVGTVVCCVAWIIILYRSMEP